ncbi:hypothetical protein MIR68_006965 [Amoeboaphelidium protococcarum]|nr:hypothetical protein MIR68_006965 [Amoeboaphelidium protococcarum]
MDIIANKSEAVFAHQLATIADKVLTLMEISKDERPSYLSIFMGWQSIEECGLTDDVSLIKAETLQRLSNKFAEAHWWTWDNILKEEFQIHALKLMMVQKPGKLRVEQAQSKLVNAVRTSQTRSLSPKPVSRAPTVLPYIPAADK